MTASASLSRPRVPGGLWLLVALAALATGACSGGNDETIADDSLQSVNRAADEGGQAGSQRRTDGEQPTEEVATVVTRPVVEIPDGWDSAVEAVYNRYWLYWEAFAAAYGPPHVDPTYEPLRALSTEENWASLQEQMDEFVVGELMLVLPEESITEHMIRIPNPSVLTDDEGTEVVLQDCWIDDFVQQTLDGDIVERTREVKLMNVSMQVVGGEWRVAGVTEATPESDGYEQCEQQLS